VRAPEEESANALAPYLHAVRSHRLLVILVVLVAAGAAVAWAGTRTLTYQATAEMLVNPLPQTDTTFLGLPLMRATGDPTTTIQTAAALVDSPQARQLTASRLGVGWTADRVNSNVAVQPQGQSNILDVTATAHSAHAAAKLANTFAAAVIDTRAARLRPLVAAAIASATAQLVTIKDPASAVAASLQDRLSQLQNAANGTDPTLSFSEAASAPSRPAGPSSALVIALAVLAGLILGAGVALAIEWLRPRRLSSEEEVARLIHAPVLTQIPPMPRRLRHHGAAAALDPPRAVREAIRNLRVQLEVMETNGSIMITSGSLGDGKTTLSIGLACELAAAGREVILVDADFRKPDLGPALGHEHVAVIEPAID
jgi:capsular polysaccharide biosynthesis protein